MLRPPDNYKINKKNLTSVPPRVKLKASYNKRKDINTVILRNCTVLNDNFQIERKDIRIVNGKISFGECSPFEDSIDLAGLTVIPGLIDIHIHGFMGVNVSIANTDDLKYMRRQLLLNGITAFTPTTSTLPGDVLNNALKTIRASSEGSDDGAEIVGVNMEGPFISKAKKGAMNEQYIRPFSESEFLEFTASSGEMIKLMTLAPDVHENLRGIDILRKNGVVPSIGHTNATADEVDNAIRIGMLHTTHLFNAMRGMSHRDPGVVGSVFDSNITAELICDGVHVNEKVIRIAYKILGRDRLILISDAIPLAGMPDGEYEFDGQRTIIGNGISKLPNGTINGNINSLFECVRRCVKQFGIPFEDAIYCASYAPAKRIGIQDRKGSISEGKDADLIVIDGDFNIKQVYRSGIPSI